MFNADMWYGGNCLDADRIDITFYPNEGIYRGNIYEGGKAIGDFACDDPLELKKAFPRLVFKWE